jgi:FkbM family methyltransferase
MRVPFAQQLGYHVRKISQWLPDIGTKVIVHLHRPFVGNQYVPIQYGSFQILVNPQDYCGGRLYYWVSYELVQTNSLINLVDSLHPGTFIDVGANIGYYSLLVAAMGVPVIAVEASPRVVPALERSILLNRDLSSLIGLVRAAAGDLGGEDTFWINEVTHNFGLGSTIRPHPQSQATAVTVPVVKLDDVIDLETPGPLLCKVDVEGAEFRVLKGMINTICTRQPVFVIEVHPIELKSAGSSAEDVLSLLWDCDYSTEAFDANRAWITHSRSIPNHNFWVVARARRFNSVSRPMRFL